MEETGAYGWLMEAGGEPDRSTKRVAAELPSHANTLTPKTIRRWLACWATSILLVATAAFFWGWMSAQREQSNRLATTLTEAPQK